MRTAIWGTGLLVLIVLSFVAYILFGTQAKTPASPTDTIETTPMNQQPLSLTSSVFTDGAPIPPKYTCDRENVSPPLSFTGVLEGAKSLVLIMEDPDVPKVLRPDGMFDHWVLFNIPPETTGIAENSSAGVEGMNTGGKTGYVGPCPPRQYEPSEHRYIFTLYALDTELSLSKGAPKEAIMRAIVGHILGEARLTGRYRRSPIQ